MIHTGKMVEVSHKDSADGQYVTTNFVVPVDAVNDALKQAHMEDIQAGDTIYLNSIFQVSINGVLQGTEYTNLDAIRNAKMPGGSTIPWPNPEDFLQYYDIKAQWDPPVGPTVTAKIQGPSQVDGTVTSVDATFSFVAQTTSTEQDLAKYEIINTQGCSFVNASDKSGALSGKEKGRTGIPIKIDIGNNPNVKCTITIEVWDTIGQHAQTSPDHSVIKYSAPPAPQNAGDTDLDPNSNGKIGADPYPNDLFNVVQGIPTHEKLYTQAGGKRYLYDYHYQQVTGSKSYTVIVSKTFNLSWKEPKTETDADGNTTITYEDKTESRLVEKTYQIKRNYSYWTVDKLSIYSIDHAEMFNYALPNGKATMIPQNYTAPSVSATNYGSLDAHITDPDYQESMTLPDENVPGGPGAKPSVPSEDWLADADRSVGKIKVKNDR
ncbi:hypothetical protein EL26_24175, partial [Tumebacillus flagellatus]